MIPELKPGGIFCTRNPMWLGRAINAAQKFWAREDKLGIEIFDMMMEAFAMILFLAGVVAFLFAVAEYWPACLFY